MVSQKAEEIQQKMAAKERYADLVKTEIEQGYQKQIILESSESKIRAELANFKTQN